MNKCLKEARVSTWMTKGKITLTQKSPQKNRPKQVQTHNMPIYDMKNTNDTNKRRDLWLANKLWIVSWGTEKVSQRIQRHKRSTLHWSTHPQREQNSTKKSTYGLDWQKSIRYASAKLNNKLPQNVQNITWSHKLYRENHENLASGIGNKRKSLGEGKIQIGIFQGDAPSTLLFIIAMMPLNHIPEMTLTDYVSRKGGRGLEDSIGGRQKRRKTEKEEDRKGGRGLEDSIEDSADASIQLLEDYTQKRKDRLITATKNNTDNTSTNWTTISRKQK